MLNEEIQEHAGCTRLINQVHAGEQKNIRLGGT